MPPRRERKQVELFQAGSSTEDTKAKLHALPKMGSSQNKRSLEKGPARSKAKAAKAEVDVDAAPPSKQTKGKPAPPTKKVQKSTEEEGKTPPPPKPSGAKKPASAAKKAKEPSKATKAPAKPAPPAQKKQGKTKRADEEPASDEDAELEIDMSRTEGIFKQAGKERKFKVGEELITQGERCGSMFLVLSGTVVVRKRQAHMPLQTAPLEEGALVGELTFLLGGVPEVSAVATSPLRVLELGHAKLLKLCADDPQLSAQMFVLLAATLAERVENMNCALRAPAVYALDRPSDPMAAAAGGPLHGRELSRDVNEVRAQFGLPKSLEGLGAAEGTGARGGLLAFAERVGVALEQFSAGGGVAEHGAIFLFRTHLCVEQSAFGLKTSTAVPLRDVLAVLRAGKGAAAPTAPAKGSKGGKKAVGKKASASGAPVPGVGLVVEIQCTALSIRLELPTQLLNARGEAPLCAAIERARLAALDTSKLASPRVGASEEGDVEQGEWEQFSSAVKLMQPSQPAEVAPLEQLGRLSPVQWVALMRGAARRTYTRGELVLRQGDDTHALYQLVSGSLRAELQEEHKLRARVVGGLEEGDLFGGRTLLLGGAAGASLLVSSAEATVLKLPAAFLRDLLASDPQLGGRLFCLLAASQATRLRALTRGFDDLSVGARVEHERRGSGTVTEVMADGRTKVDYDSGESHRYKDSSMHKLQVAQGGSGGLGGHVLPAEHSAPTEIEELVANPAYLAILGRYLHRSNPELAPLVDFLLEARALKVEPELDALRAAAAALHAKYFVRDSRPKPKAGPAKAPPKKAKKDAAAAHADTVDDAAGAVAVCVPVAERAAVGKALGDKRAAVLRAAFDDACARCVAKLGAVCLDGFLASAQYAYVLQLHMRARMVPSMAHFRAVRVLGQGGFGQVLEVVKRDCGKHYAMKVQKKAELVASLEGLDDWQEVVLLEKNLQAQLHHPLLVNLAYAFQDPVHLVLIMDACPGGDLSQFVLPDSGMPALTTEQLRFVGAHVVAVLGFLHSRRVAYRDLKPENLLLDAEGQVRLIDFGLAIAGEPDGPMPTSIETAGTTFYMAPEVADVEKWKPPYHGGAADWYTLGVLLYELGELELPYGDDPPYASKAKRDAEWRKPTRLLKADAQLAGLVTRLLAWEPKVRLGTKGGVAEVQAHAWWGQAGAVEWELVEGRRLPSPLKALLEGRAAQREEKLASQRAKAVETAANLARARGALSDDAPKPSSKIKADRLGQFHRGQHPHSTEAGGGGGGGGKARKKPAQRKAADVKGWDFVSPHAITQEYTDNLTSMVSLL